MASQPSLIAIIFWALVTFSLLVVIHEGGHFFAARWFKVRVHEFMIGLPGPSLRFRGKKSGTYFGITAVPLGGYVRIAGMEPGAEDPRLAKALATAAVLGTIDAPALARSLEIERDDAASLLATLADWGALEESTEDDHSYVSVAKADEAADADALLARYRVHTYRGLKTWQRIVVLSMGVLMNLLTAILIFTVTLSVFGMPAPSRTLETVAKSSPAAKAGLQKGDTIVAVAGVPVRKWESVLKELRTHKPGETITVVYERDGQRAVAVATLAAKPDGTPLLGVTSAATNVRVPVLEALRLSFEWTGMVFVAIGQFFNPATFQASVGNARSVVGISVEAARAAETGILNYAWLVALLSL
jgi:regulator of sigma E protease